MGMDYGNGLAVATGSLDYDSVFLVWQTGVGRCPELDETFPSMLPGWSEEMVGVNFMMISPRVTAERHRAGNGD